MSLYELIFGPFPSTIAKHPECFFQSPIHPSDRQRTVPMEVLSLGMSRTGTASMHKALTQLGHETYHGFRSFADAQDYDLWNPAYETKYFNRPSEICPKVDRAFFDRALGHLGAVTDMPPISFACELLEAYPEAKIILVERDEESWCRSFENAFVKAYEDPLGPYIARLDPNQFGKLYRCLTRGASEGQFGASNAAEFRANARATYRAHYAAIRKLIRDRGEESRLLEYRLGEGWEPLCKFLGKTVPGDEFPRVNETGLMQEKIKIMYMNSTRKFVGRVSKWTGSLLVVGTLAWYLS